MNRFRLIFVSCLIFVLMVSGCGSSGGSQADQITTSPQITDPAALYSQSAEKIQEADLISYYITTVQTTFSETQVFTRSSQQRLNIQDPGKETMRSSMIEVLTVGNSSVAISEFFKNGNGYITVDDSAFTAPLSTEIISQRYTPAVCFDPKLYEEIVGISKGSITQIAFSEANAAESWALPDNAIFAEASGYAVVDENGDLQESVYSLSYTIGSAVITQTTKIIMLKQGQVILPDASKTYIPIEYFDAPRMLEQACGYLLQAENISSTAETNINCQTFSINRNQTSNLTLAGAGEDFYALMDVYINQTNKSRDGETTEIRQTETFENGIYSISVDGAESTQNKDINASAMKNYCQALLIQNVLLPQHISGVTAEESDNVLTLTFQASDSFAEAICSNICTLLYSDSELLHTLSSSYETQSVQCTLSLDKSTGLPLFFSSEYSALHNIEEISYLLESKTEQSYKYIKESGQ